MMVGMATFGAVFLALAIAAVVGPLLGRLATQWFSGRGLSNLLTEIRGAFLPFLVAALLFDRVLWPGWVVIGLVVGANQAIAVGRWVARRSGEWSPSLIGGIALGRSRAALLSAHATARGAVIGTLAITFHQVILLEAVLSGMGIQRATAAGSIGESIFNGAGAETPVVVAVGAGTLIATEIATSWLFQRRGSGQ